MTWLSDPDAWSALAALLALEIVLGVDNVIFISILASKLPADQQGKARRIGLLAAGGMRLLLLLAVGWVISLKKELFTIGDLGFSGKELILLAGGVFLIYKATKEIHHKLEGEAEHASSRTAPTLAAGRQRPPGTQCGHSGSPETSPVAASRHCGRGVSEGGPWADRTRAN